MVVGENQKVKEWECIGGKRKNWEAKERSSREIRQREHVLLHRK